MGQVFIITIFEQKILTFYIQFTNSAELFEISI